MHRRVNATKSLLNELLVDVQVRSRTIENDGAISGFPDWHGVVVTIPGGPHEMRCVGFFIHELRKEKPRAISARGSEYDMNCYSEYSEMI